MNGSGAPRAPVNHRETVAVLTPNRPASSATVRPAWSLNALRGLPILARLRLAPLDLQTDKRTCHLRPGPN